MTSDLAESLPMLWGDDASLQRVLINLLDNAINASKEGGRLNISARASAACEAKRPGVYIEVTTMARAYRRNCYRKFSIFL